MPGCLAAALACTRCSLVDAMGSVVDADRVRRRPRVEGGQRDRVVAPTPRRRVIRQRTIIRDLVRRVERGNSNPPVIARAPARAPRRRWRRTTFVMRARVVASRAGVEVALGGGELGVAHPGLQRRGVDLPDDERAEGSAAGRGSAARAGPRRPGRGRGGGGGRRGRGVRRTGRRTPSHPGPVRGGRSARRASSAAAGGCARGTESGVCAASAEVTTPADQTEAATVSAERGSKLYAPPAQLEDLAHPQAGERGDGEQRSVLGVGQLASLGGPHTPETAGRGRRRGARPPRRRAPAP